VPFNANNSPTSNGGQLGRKVARYKRNRRAIAMSTPASPPYTVPTLVGVGSGAGSGVGPGSVLTVNFDQQVSVNTLSSAPKPTWQDVTQSPPLTVVAVVQDSPTQVSLTFSGTIQPGDVIVIFDLDYSIRTGLGGFVNPGAYTAP
jgi:hypothetical protein